MTCKKRPVRFFVRAVVGLVMIAVVVSLLPVPDTTPAAQAAPALNPVSLSLDGTSPLVVLTSVAEPASKPFFSLAALAGTEVGVRSIDTPIVLGAPGEPTATVLGDDDGCSWWNPLCAGGWIKTTVLAVGCVAGVLSGAGLVLMVVVAHVCLMVGLKIAGKIAGWALSVALRAIIMQFNSSIKVSVANMTRYLLVHVLGGNQIFTPIVNCKLYQSGSQTTDGNCDDSWFTGQFAIMRIIGLFLLPPLLLLVILQSLIRGSLFFLLRAFLVYLPIAFFGSVMITVFVQLLLNISDDMSLYLAQQTTDPSAFGEEFALAIEQMDNKFGLFKAIWLLGLLLSYVIILAELILRELGIYLTMMFMPMAFATMVYPPTMKWLRRGVDVVIGLIFMKLFIVAALSMGFAAMASGADTITADGDVDNTMSQIILACIIMLFAGFGGTKILSFTPVSTARQNGLASPASALGMGDFTSQRLDAAVHRQNGRTGDASEGGKGSGRIGRTVSRVRGTGANRRTP